MRDGGGSWGKPLHGCQGLWRQNDETIFRNSSEFLNKTDIKSSVSKPELYADLAQPKAQNVG